MGNNTRAPIIKAPELLDVVINNIQTGLTDNLGWLDKAFGRAERLVKYGANQKKIYTPNIYIGGNEYQEVTPDAGIGNFSFFWIDDPQTVDWTPKQSIGLKSPFSLILEIREFRKNCLFDSLKSSKTYKCKSLQTLHPYLKYSFCNCVLISLRANKICCSTVRFETDSSRAISEGVRFSKKDRQ